MKSKNSVVIMFLIVMYLMMTSIGCNANSKSNDNRALEEVAETILEKETSLKMVSDNGEVYYFNVKANKESSYRVYITITDTNGNLVWQPSYFETTIVNEDGFTKKSPIDWEAAEVVFDEIDRIKDGSWEGYFEELEAMAKATKIYEIPTGSANQYLAIDFQFPWEFGGKPMPVCQVIKITENKEATNIVDIGNQPHRYADKDGEEISTRIDPIIEHGSISFYYESYRLWSDDLYDGYLFKLVDGLNSTGVYPYKTKDDNKYYYLKLELNTKGNNDIYPYSIQGTEPPHEHIVFVSGEK